MNGKTVRWTRSEEGVGNSCKERKLKSDQGQDRASARATYSEQENERQRESENEKANESN